jgi:hypothetical protein
MNAPNASKRNGILMAIGIIVLLLGAATGNAYVMFAVAIAALVAVAIFGRQSFRWSVLFGMMAAAATAIAVVIVITSF